MIVRTNQSRGESESTVESVPVIKDAEGFSYNMDNSGKIIPEDIDEMLARAVVNNASDLHLVVGAPPKIRIYGQLVSMNYSIIDPETSKRLLSKIIPPFVMETFESTGEADFSHSVKNISRFRVNIFKQRGSWAGVFRTTHSEIPTPEKLGIPDVVMEMASRKRGLVLVTGPTGSGKSTTLAAIIEEINKNRRENIITVEDPIEYVYKHKLSNVNQRELGSDTKSFPNAIRAALREDPDIILIGEMRDLETMAAAVTAAETGHLVFSTLHTIGAAATVDRIIDGFPESQHNQIRVQLASVLECVVSQQLLPLVGGRGRVAAFEIMLGNIAIKNLIRENKTVLITSQIQSNAKEGMILMDESIFNLYKEQKISLETAIEFAVDKVAMQKRLKTAV